MISLLSALLGLWLIALMFRRNRAAFVAGFFILFSLTYRIIDILYLDLFGPTYAVELGRYVGGHTATPMFVLSCLAFLLPLWIAFRPAAMARKLGGQIPNLAYFAVIRRWAFPVCAAFIAVVYLDMLRKGTIPLLVGMDRLEYNLQSGIFHRPLYSLSFLLAITLGTFTVLPRLQGGRFDLRFAMLFLAVLLYWILTGNRFSIFYRDVSFFMLPFGTALAMEASGKLPRIARRDAWSALFSSRVVIPVAVMVTAVTLTGLLINSFYEVRQYSDPLFQMSQRGLVQPVQLWDVTWATQDYDRVRLFEPDVARFLFVDPLDPSSNTSIQYLMVRELGYFRTSRLLFYGTQYAGGYPEILFELFGPWGAVPALFLIGLVTALLLRMSTIALSRGHLLTSLLAVYVYFGFSLTYIGGMLNFIAQPSFAVKVLLLIAAAFFETATLKRLASRRAQRGHGRLGAPA